MSTRPVDTPVPPFAPGLPEEAWAWIDAELQPLEAETVPTAEAAGRVLAGAVRVAAPVPAQARAGVDGYALAARDTHGAGDYSPLPLRLHARPPARLGPGEACRIASGEPLPEGADAVLPLDRAEASPGCLEAGASLAPGEHVVGVGEEASAGSAPLAPGRRLRPQDLAWLIGAGVGEVAVRRRPRVRILLARAPQADADGPMLTALVARDGGEPLGSVRCGDRAALEAALRRPEADLVLVVGGTGFGPEDHAPAAVAAAGELVQRGVAMHPGETAGLGRCAGVPVVLLPGWPLACLSAYDLLAARALRRLAGLPPEPPYRRVQGVLTRKVASSLGRLELCRVRVTEAGVEPLSIAEGRVLATAVQADGFVVVPLQSEGHAEGATVTVHLYDD